MKRLWKEDYKVFLGIVIGMIVSSIGVYAATTIAGSNITYSNTTSGLTSTNVQGAIDELYEKADLGKALSKAGKFVAAYTYSESGSNLCIMGNEATCKKTTCYQTKTAGSCLAGTIILYKVNNNNLAWFNVLVDKGNTITMKSQKRILPSLQWTSKADYVAAGGTEANYGEQGANDKGPLTVLQTLENATKGWSNVNDQTYSIGDSSSTLGYSGCSRYNSCTVTSYPKLEKSNVKARMITVQEAVNYGGCTSSANSCKKFMTTNGTESYWTMSTLLSNSAWYVHAGGSIRDNIVSSNFGVPAVVEVNK